MNQLAKQSVVVTSFQRTFPEDWGSSNDNDHFSKMIAFDQWNYGDGQRGIMSSIKKIILSYKNAERS